jgi:D-arabinan exo alpha-(1,3)/(1,5)-arabinofuranosidase (non-reducing end)
MHRLLIVLVLAAVAAIPVAIFADRHAAADARPGEDGYVYREAEGMLPALESYASNAQGSATQSVAQRQGNADGLRFSGQAQVLFDNHNGDGSRATLPFDVPEGGLYAVAATFARGPAYGIVDVSIDGRPAARGFDGYAAAPERVALDLGHLELAAGRHTITLTAIGKAPASSDYLAGLDFVELRGL